MPPSSPLSTLFPYTTLFRSILVREGVLPETTAAPRSTAERSAVTAACKSYGSSPPCLSRDRKSTRLNSSHLVISYAVFCLKKKKYKTKHQLLTNRTKR